MKKALLILLCLLGADFGMNSAYGALPLTAPHSRQLSGTWQAQWICDGNASALDYGVYLFRKRIALTEKPSRFVLSISADNRYRLYVNGQEACWGPARGDLNRWYYETVDIAPLLHSGDNLLAVEVWNIGMQSPGAQISRQTGLIVQGDTPAEDPVNTNNSWLVCRNEAFSPLWNYPPAGYMGAQDRIDGSKYPWGWETLSYDDSKWTPALGFSFGKTYGAYGYGESDWILTPRDIPMMEQTLQRLAAVRRFTGIHQVTPFIQGESPLHIPARTECTILLDQEFLTTAYPQLTVSGGKGSQIRMTYAEALFNEQGKANRNQIEGRRCEGLADEFLPDGASNRTFCPLWFKTYRYIQLDIHTADDPLVVEDLYGIYTGYPFPERGAFRSEQPELDKIWQTGWRTARLCAHETYFDCPYYEQLQYVGDTRIQALISLYVSGDDRLMRKAIRMYDLSRSYEGITGSRYPSRIPQYIPPFSLYWVGMIHDYWMHRSDDAFVRSFLPGIQTVLNWFIQKIDPATGLLKGKLPHWNFVDWAVSWERGVPPESDLSGSAVTTLQLAAALSDAAALMKHYGCSVQAKVYSDIRNNILKNVYSQCWDPQRKLLRDCMGGNTYSQHVNVMGILTDAIPHREQKAVFQRVISDSSLTQTTFYYKFYLIRALKKVGMADLYVGMLAPWQQMIDMGLTTFAETPEPTRSDCHAWSASPNYDLLATVCGVEPASPGFASVRIAPHPGLLRQIEGVVPHPQGNIEVSFRRDESKLSGSITLPGTLEGKLIWKEKQLKLKPGKNSFDM